MNTLTGPQRVALFFLRDETAHGGAYVGNVTRLRRPALTFRVLYGLGLVSSDSALIFDGTYVSITERGRAAIANMERPARSRS